MYTKQQMQEYIRSLDSGFYELKEPEADHMILETDNACGEIIFHPQDIIELQIADKADGENRFYLHFQLREEDHAKELIDEMIASLKQMRSAKVTRVLLTCTSALTTSYFAGELNRAAEAMRLSYRFAAVSLNMIYDKGFDCDIILVAPQAAYEYENIRRIFFSKTVLKIPGSLFGQYNTGGVLQMIMEAAGEKKAAKEEELTKALRSAFDNRYRILSICLINHKNEYRIGYRIYDHGKKTLDKEVIKQTFSIQDIDDLIGYVLVRHKYIHAIGLALPGVAYHGKLFHKHALNLNVPNLGMHLTEKYRKPVILINDVNAIALGYFALHEHSENMVFHFQPRGMKQAGAGIIIDSRLHRGWKSAAGEIADMINAVVENGEQKIMTPEGALEIVGKSLLGYIAILAPEKIVIYSELTPDMQALYDYLKQYTAEEYIPELIHVTHLKEYMIPGAMIHALEILEKDPDSFAGPGTKEQNSLFVQLLMEARTRSTE